MKALLVEGGIEIPDLDDALSRIEETAKLVAILPRHMDLRQACAFKGVNHRTVANNHMLQPQIGVSTQKIGTKNYYTREAIEKWSSVFDGNIKDYIHELLNSDDEVFTRLIEKKLQDQFAKGNIERALWLQIKDWINAD